MRCVGERDCLQTCVGPFSGAMSGTACRRPGAAVSGTLRAWTIIAQYLDFQRSTNESRVDSEV